jgi:predicted metal-binding protein
LPLRGVVVETRVRGLCRLPYPGHPRGCPNFDHKAGCPPRCPMWEERYDLSEPAFAIVNEFNLAEHIARMRGKHPSWTERQLECCLYWQPRARRQLQDEIPRFYRVCRTARAYRIDTCPEASGVNVTETLRIAGVELEWPPKMIVRQVAIAAALRGVAA